MEEAVNTDGNGKYLMQLIGPSLFGSGFQIEGHEKWVVLGPSDENRITNDETNGHGVLDDGDG
jgi:hypothetical protein